jgi:hypothetical protein
MLSIAGLPRARGYIAKCDLRLSDRRLVVRPWEDLIRIHGTHSLR